MRARVDRQKQTLYITEIRLLSGWLPEDGIGNERGKDKNNPPLRGCSVSVTKTNFYGVYTNKYTRYLEVWIFVPIFAPNFRAIEPCR